MIDRSPLTPHYGLILTADTAEELGRLSKQEIQDLVDLHGALLFRCPGHRLYKNNFLDLSTRFSDQFVIHGARVRRPLSVDGTVQTVTEGPDAIVLHAEMHFSPFSPSYMWFFCDLAPSYGGETTLCDGRLFYSHLSDKAKNLLLSKNLKYWNLWDKETWKRYFSGASKSDIVDTFSDLKARAWFNSDDELEFEVIKPAIQNPKSSTPAFVNSIAVHHQYKKNAEMFHTKDQAGKLRHKICFEDGSEIPDWLNHELEQVESKLVFPIKWRNGDLVLLDNRRVLHGRNAFDPTIQRSIMVRMAKAA